MSPHFEIGVPAQPSEIEPLLALVVQSLGFPADRASDWLRQLGPENVRIARYGAHVAGVYGVIPMGLWLRAVPTGGVAAVAVALEDRSSGVGSLMMRHAITEMRAAHYPLAALYTRRSFTVASKGSPCRSGPGYGTSSARCWRRRSRSVACAKGAYSTPRPCEAG